jgi:outer membrane protein
LSMMKWSRPRASLALMLSLACPAAAAAGGEDAVAEAKRLLEGGQAAAAFELLARSEPPADDIEFDYLYGIAALDAGHPGLALFAFERVLASDPSHVFARAELGRALLALGETHDALREFRAVRAVNPPAEVLARIAQYEAALAPTARQAYRIGGYVEAFFGYDSNYNSATSAGEVAIPAFNNLIFTLDELFTENDSATGGGRGAGYLAAPISERSTFIGNLGLEGAGYTAADDGYFYITLSGSLGVHHRHDADDSFTISANGFNTWVGDFNYLHVIGGTGSWRHALNETDSTEAFVRVATLNYDEVIEYRDVRQYLAGANWVREAGRRWTLGVGAFGGLEDERDDARPDVGRELYGARLFGGYQVNERLRLSGEVTGQFSDYRGTDNLFQRTRDDELVRVSVAARYDLAPHWSLRPELRYTNNSSNIPTSDYERFEGLVFVRREFE